MIAATHPDLLPIPEDISVGKGWTGQMIEMADHIGAYPTMLVVDRFGGQYLYIAADPRQNALRHLIGDAKATIMSHVYGKERLRIPTAKTALRLARRQGIIAAVRAGLLTSYAGARMLRTSQPYLSYLVNHSDEGQSRPPSLPRRARDEHQLDMFG